MIGLLYLLYALLNLALLLWAVHRYRSLPTLAAGLAIPVAAGLLYDNLVLYLGSALSAGQLLFALNWPRYLLEALVAPLFVPLFADLARRAGIRWLAARPAIWLVAAATLALVGYGVVNLSTLALVPTVSFGALRYVSASFDLPLIGVAVTFAALVAGAAIWQARGWPWLVWAALAVFVGSGAAVALGSDMICPVTNAAELVLLAAALECERYLLFGPHVRSTLVMAGR